MSARVFADMAKTSDASIIRIENGKQLPSPGLLKRIHEATEGEVTPNDLLSVEAVN